MTEKVVLTKEQAEAIDEIKDIDYAINIHSFNKRPDSPLADMKTSELARALFAGYEVEPEFSVGDWVVHEYDKKPRKIIRKSNYKNGDCGEYVVDNGMGVTPEFLRHATPEEIAEEKERRWWSELGREVGEYRTCDIVQVEGCQGLYEVVEIIDKYNISVTRDFADTEFLTSYDQMTLSCPVENRLDVKPNES